MQSNEEQVIYNSMWLYNWKLDKTNNNKDDTTFSTIHKTFLSVVLALLIPKMSY